MIRRIRRAYLPQPPVYYASCFAVLTLGGIISKILAFTGEFVWEPPEAYLVLFLLLLCNTLLKSILAFRNNERVWTQIERGAFRLVGYTMLLMLCFNFGKHEPTLFWLPSVAMGPLALFQLIVLLRDLIHLRWVDSAYARHLLSKLESKYPSMMDVIHKTNGNDSQHP